MVSKESKERAIKQIIIGSLVFVFASFILRWIDILLPLIFIISFTLFAISGMFFVSAMLIVLYDRRSFIELVKNDFRYMYRNMYRKLNKKTRKK